MSTFTTTLFKLLAAADVTVIGGYEIETVQDFGHDKNGEPIMRCECDDDNEWHFSDQEVTVRDGSCTAKTAEGDWPDQSRSVNLDFQVRRPLEACDLPPPRS